MKTIPKAVAPETWKKKGGGAIHRLGRVLAIRQTDRVHVGIRRFLAEYERARSLLPKLPAKAESEKKGQQKEMGGTGGGFF